MYRVTTLIGGNYVTGGGIQEFYFASSGTLTAQNAASAARTFWAAFTTALASGTTFAVQPEVETVSAVNGDVTAVSAVTATIVTCSGTGSIGNPASQGLIRWRTGFFSDGREIRGRTFIPAMATSLVDASGNPTSSFLTVANAAGAALIADANSVMLVWRRPKYTGKKPNRVQVRDGAEADVTSASTWSKLAVLRSRRD